MGVLQLMTSHRSHNRDWPQAGCGRAVPERSRGVKAPTITEAGSGFATAVKATDRGAYLRENETVCYCHGSIALCGCPVAKLATRIVAPAVSPVIAFATNVDGPRGYAIEANAPSHCPRPETPADSSAIAKLAEEIVAPAEGPAAGGDRAAL